MLIFFQRQVMPVCEGQCYSSKYLSYLAARPRVIDDAVGRISGELPPDEKRRSACFENTAPQPAAISTSYSELSTFWRVAGCRRFNRGKANLATCCSKVNLDYWRDDCIRGYR
jgi:hypothetical protein